MYTVCKERDYVCKRLRVYNHLSENGFMPKRKIRDIDNPRYYVWFYEPTDELQECLNKYFNKLN